MTAELERVDVVEGQVPLPGMPEKPAPVLSPVDAVLAAIDGALEDWTVSDDAMRWSPDPENADEPEFDWDDDKDWEPTTRPGRTWKGTPTEFEGNRLLTFGARP